MKRFPDTHWRWVVTLAATAVGLALYHFGRPWGVPVKHRAFRQRTVGDVLAPHDPREQALSADGFPEWVAERYREIETACAGLVAP